MKVLKRNFAVRVIFSLVYLACLVVVLSKAILFFKTGFTLLNTVTIIFALLSILFILIASFKLIFGYLKYDEEKLVVFDGHAKHIIYFKDIEYLKKTKGFTWSILIHDNSSFKQIFIPVKSESVKFKNFWNTVTVKNPKAKLL
ncbi:MAG: hypothetical protein K6F69_00535 [Treponema sp.]|nr:hypothetical protein [Treponema sp.]